MFPSVTRTEHCASIYPLGKESHIHRAQSVWWCQTQCLRATVVPAGWKELGRQRGGDSSGEQKPLP